MRRSRKLLVQEKENPKKPDLSLTPSFIVLTLFDLLFHQFQLK
uniref:Uncharacterized protein n=1 Tax=Ciona intestinalis TaxID=7719 RepID=H2Y2Q6_CIOIN